MTQDECLKALSKKKWLTAKEIHKKINRRIGIGSVTTNLKQIRKFKLAKYKQVMRKNQNSKATQPAYAYKKK